MSSHAAGEFRLTSALIASCSKTAFALASAGVGAR